MCACVNVWIVYCVCVWMCVGAVGVQQVPRASAHVMHTARLSVTAASTMLPPVGTKAWAAAKISVEVKVRCLSLLALFVVPVS